MIKRLFIFWVFVMSFSILIASEKILNLQDTKIEIKENKIYDTSENLYTGKILLKDGVSILDVKEGDITKFNYTNKGGNIEGTVSNNFFEGEILFNSKEKGEIKAYFHEGLIEKIESSKYKEVFKEGILIKGIDKEKNIEYKDFSKFTYLIKGISYYDAVFAFLGVSKKSLETNGVYLKRKDFYNTEWDVMKNSKKIIYAVRINELGMKFIIFYDKNGDTYQIIRDDGDSLIVAIVKKYEIKRIMIEDYNGEVFLKKEIKENEKLDEKISDIKEQFRGMYEKRSEEQLWN